MVSSFDAIPNYCAVWYCPQMTQIPTDFFRWKFIFNWRERLARDHLLNIINGLMFYLLSTDDTDFHRFCLY